MDVEITANDDFPLAARIFRATKTNPEPVGAVLLVGAMGVPQRFYEPLARWLAERGFTTMTFDFRGMGASKRGSLADLDADIVRDWAERDTAAALDALAARAPGLPGSGTASADRSCRSSRTTRSRTRS